MVYRATGFNTNGQVKPSEDVDPNYKNTKPNYSIAMAKFLYSMYMRNQCAVKTTDLEDIKINRDYAAGQQSSDIYKRMLLGDQDSPVTITNDDSYASLLDAREGMYSVDFEHIFSPAPKFISNIQGMFDQVEHRLVVEAIDENSYSLKQLAMYESLFDGEQKPFIDYINLTMGLPGQEGKPLPKNVEEMKMFAQMGNYTLAYEIAMRRALKYTEQISNDKKIKRRVVGDLLTLGKSGIVAYSDSAGVVKYKYADPADIIIEDSNEEDCSDATWGAVNHNYTVADFRNETGLSEDDVKEFLSPYLGTDVSIKFATENENGSYLYDQNKIPVLECFWIGQDSTFRTKHRDGRTFEEAYKGNGMRQPKMYNTENRKTTKDVKLNLYSCKWVVNTDFVWDYGKVKDIPFDYYTKRPRLPIQLFRIPGKPLISQMIPILDQIELTYLQLQNAIAKMPPPGLAIEISSLENISIGNKKISPLDLITIRNQTGNMLYRLAPPAPGSPIGSQNPIAPLPSGVDSSVATAINSLGLFYMELERVTGVSQTAVSNIDPQQGLGVSQINLATTSNTLRPCLVGWQTLKENTGTYCAVKIQSHVGAATDSPYKTILGVPNFTALKSAMKMPPAAWGVFVKAKMDAALQAELLGAAKAALSVGKDGVPILSFSEYLYVMEMINDSGDASAVRAYIAYKEQEAQQKAFQQSQMTMANQGKVNEQLTMVKAEAEEKTKKTETEMELQKINAKFQADAMLAKINHEYKMREMSQSKPPEKSGT